MKEETIKLIKLLVELDDSMLPCELERIAGLIEPKSIGTFAITSPITLENGPMRIKTDYAEGWIIGDGKVIAAVKNIQATPRDINPRCHCCCRC